MMPQANDPSYELTLLTRQDLGLSLGVEWDAATNGSAAIVPNASVTLRRARAGWLSRDGRRETYETEIVANMGLQLALFTPLRGLTPSVGVSAEAGSAYFGGPTLYRSPLPTSGVSFFFATVFEVGLRLFEHGRWQWVVAGQAALEVAPLQLFSLRVKTGVVVPF
jgi:hypothetical protein